MYKSMKELHLKQMAERHEEHELEDGFRALRAIRRSIIFSNQVKQLQLFHDERRARWRAYRSRR